MVKTISKRRKKVANILFLFLLATFPFGQIIKIGIVNLFDVLAVLIALFSFLTIRKYPAWYKYFIYFWAFALFSWIVNLFITKNLFIIKSLLYVLRLFVYFQIPVFVAIYVHIKNKEKVLNSLLFVTIVTAILGWVQYFIFPDTRSLKILNWDDHYFRLIGTFLDPGFLAIILVLGSILALYKKRYFAFGFLVITILFTYSRTGYLALIFSTIYYFWKAKKPFLYLLMFGLFITTIFFLLPKNTGGEGVKLTRTSTIDARLLDYKKALRVFKISPALGTGFGNSCNVKINYLGEKNTDSHSCFGFDSSVTFLLTTVGVIGLILFIYLGRSMLITIESGKYYLLLTSSLIAVFISGLFSNTLFYPHVMAWLGVLVGLGSKVNRKSS